MRASMRVIGSVIVMGLLLSAQSASAHHQQGDHCRNDPHTHSKGFYKEKAEEEGVPRGQIRRRHVHHKHQCKSQYPPRANRATAEGRAFTTPVETNPGGLTVGTATAIALGSLGGLLVARRIATRRRTG